MPFLGSPLVERGQRLGAPRGREGEEWLVGTPQVNLLQPGAWGVSRKVGREDGHGAGVT